MKRLTTPTHTFSLSDLPLNTISKLRITYEQNGVKRLEKDENDVTMANGKVSVTLTQQDTKKFTAGTVDVQLRILTVDGKSLASEIFSVSVEDVLNEEVLE